MTTTTLAWRPIEEAPKDGTELLLTHYNSSGYGEVDFGHFGFLEVSDADGRDVYDWLTNYGRIEEPTHFILASALVMPTVPSQNCSEKTWT